MNGTAARMVRFGVGLVGLVALGWILTGQAAQPGQHGMPTDWTHRHVIFSRPANAKQAALVERDPRYQQQWARRNMVRSLSHEGEYQGDTFPASLNRSTGKPAVHGDWSESMGTGASVGAGNFPAKYSFSTSTANCDSSGSTQPDFVVYSTGLAGSATQASVVAYDNLYSGCTAVPVPNVYWAYNTGGQILTSPVISLDGTQVAFVETNGGFGILVLLKWAPGGSVASPGTLNVVANTAYRGCTAPCATQILLENGSGIQTDDTSSSVYYDYTSDTGWVGGALGWLHKINGMFNGATPDEVRTAPWPVQVNPPNTTALSSPVYDYISGNVFVGDAGGYVERVNATTGVSTVSGQVDFGTGIVAGPALDPTSGLVYVYASNNGVANCSGTNACAAVYQFSTSFPAGDMGSQTHLGASSSTAPNPLYDGAFDSAYESSTNATGTLYVCGRTGANPALYRVPITAGAMPVTGTVITSVATAASTAACSPVTDVSNPSLGEERLFLSPQNNGRPTACGANGCLESFVDTPWQASTSYALGQQILSSRDRIEVAITAGTSGPTAPAWTAANGATLTDGSVTWLDQGGLSAVPLASWTSGHTYGANARIIDTNGNVEITLLGGLSGVSQPTWSATLDANTLDGVVIWTNAAPLPVSAFQATGGASGAIIDNTVGSGTLAGASQVYFSTLGNQLCTTSGTTGGCAVQASQSALQ